MLFRLTSANEPQNLREESKPHLVKVILSCRKPKTLHPSFSPIFTSASYTFLQGKWLAITSLRQWKTQDEKHYKTLVHVNKWFEMKTKLHGENQREEQQNCCELYFWIPFLLNKVWSILPPPHIMVD